MKDTTVQHINRAVFEDVLDKQKTNQILMSEDRLLRRICRYMALPANHFNRNEWKGLDQALETTFGIACLGISKYTCSFAKLMKKGMELPVFQRFISQAQELSDGGLPGPYCQLVRMEGYMDPFVMVTTSPATELTHPVFVLQTSAVDGTKDYMWVATLKCFIVSWCMEEVVE